jgi:ABC-type nitrate/sulfonate/bicarbonate transport system permease component
VIDIARPPPPRLSGRPWIEAARVHVLPPLVVLALLLGVAQALKGLDALPISVPAPSTVIATAVANAGILWFHVKATLRAAAAGYVIAATVAFVLAAGTARFPRSTPLIYNFATIIYTLPLIALAPILVVWFGTGIEARVTIAAIAGFFPILVGSIQGLRTADREARELLFVLSATSWQRFYLLSLPSALPFIFAGLKIAAANAVFGAIVSEWVGAEQGLGLMMAYALFSFNVPQVWLTIIVTILIALAAYLAVQTIERVVVRWTPPIASSGEVAETAGATTGSAVLRFGGQILLFVALFVGAWYGAIWVLALKPYILPSPATTLAVFGTQAALLASDLGLTLRTALVGLAISATLAITLAGLFIAYPALARTLLPFAIAIRSAPVVAVAPLITLLVGRGVAAGIVVVVVASFFAILVNASSGFRSTSPSHLELMHVHAASKLQTFRMIRLPFALSHIFTGLRTAAPIAVLGAMLSEWITGSRGLGYLIQESGSMIEVPLLWAAILVSMATGLAVFWCMSALELVALRQR